MIHVWLTLLAVAFPGQTADTTLPGNARVLLVAEGRGVQIYRCAAQGEAFAWTFVAPEATLFAMPGGQAVGTHGAGPSWTWNDGSGVMGTVVAKMPSPEAGSIPWLLLSAKSAGAPGALAGVAFMRRSETHGGIAPASGCDQQHEGVVVRVEYRAAYTFYAPETK